MRIVNEFAPGAIAAGATIEYPPAGRPAIPRRVGVLRRLRALAALLRRRRRAALAIAQLDELDAATRRDLGLGEPRGSALDIAASVATARRQNELDFLLSASSRFELRNVDAGH